jgi:hypothetical protein
MHRTSCNRHRLPFAILVAAGLAAVPAAATVTVTVGRPLDGDTLVSPISVQAEATTDADNAQVISWQVFSDGVTAYGTGPAPGMAARLNLDKGSHEIVVTAQDSTGDSTSVTLTIVIGTCAGFTVSLDSPAGGSETSPVHFAASASSCHRITGFAFYSDDHEIFNQRGSRSVDTTIELPAGNHTIYARAWDSTGAYVNSSAVPVDVAPPPTPPTPVKPPPAARTPQAPPAQSQAPPAPPPAAP